MDFPFPKSYGLTSWYIENSSAGSLQMVAAAMKLKHGCSLEEKLWKKKKKSYDQPRQHIKKKRYYFTSKGLYRQSYGFSSNHVWLWELDNKKSWELKNWCFWTMVLEETLESPVDSKETKPVHPKGNQSWIFTGRTDAEAETPILWPPDSKNWPIWNLSWCSERLSEAG